MHRIGPEAALADEVIRIADQIDDAEEAHVVKREQRAVVEVEHHARKALDISGQIAGHPEVQAQPDIARLGEQMLAVPPHAREPPPHQLAQRRRPHGEDALVEHAHAGDGAPQRMPREGARVGLDLG
jgi:hypothetical protein